MNAEPVSVPAHMQSVLEQIDRQLEHAQEPRYIVQNLIQTAQDQGIDLASAINALVAVKVALKKAHNPTPSRN